MMKVYVLCTLEGKGLRLSKQRRMHLSVLLKLESLLLTQNCETENRFDSLIVSLFFFFAMQTCALSNVVFKFKSLSSNWTVRLS